MKATAITIILSVFAALWANAQPLSIRTEIDSSAALIGDHIELCYIVAAADSVYFRFPVFTDTITSGIEIISISSIDSNIVNGERIYKQCYRLISFDTGSYMLPAGPFVTSASDTVWGQKTELLVHSIEISPDAEAFEIKMPYSAPLSFREVLPYILAALAAAATIAALVFAYIWYQKRKPIATMAMMPSEPAYIIAYRELDSLKVQNLWQQGKYKMYYTRLSDIIRQYIEHSINLPALELTTEETIAGLRASAKVTPAAALLAQQLFVEADLVKFAKAEPGAAENEASFTRAFDFISQTKNSFHPMPGTEKDDQEKTETT
jgi:hypothetical protein